jgi:signal peptidase I
LPEQLEARTAEQRAQDLKRTPADNAVPVGRWAWEWTKSIVIVFALVVVFRAFLVEAFRIPTGSMEPTLLIGDFLLVNKAIYGIPIPFTSLRTPPITEPRRGDIIVFAPPHEPAQNYVKRLVGAPGDTVAMRNRTLFINDKPVTEPYVRHSDPHDVRAPAMDWLCSHLASHSECRPSRDTWGPLVVPAGRYLVLGDNRDDSEDSRYWGFVERAAIKGRPIAVYYSFDPAAAGRLPWATAIRWARLGSTLH